MDEIEHVFSAVKKLVRANYYRWCKNLGWSDTDILDWVESVSGEGLAIAYRQRYKWKKERAGLVQWVYLHTRRIAHQELEHFQKRRYVQSVSKQGLSLVKETLNTNFVGVPSPTYRDSLGEHLLSGKLDGLLKELTPDQQAALGLYYLAEFEIPKIARIIGCSPKTVYTLLDRGRQKARQLYRRLHSADQNQVTETPPRAHRKMRRPSPKEPDDEAEEPPPNRLVLDKERRVGVTPIPYQTEPDTVCPSPERRHLYPKQGPIKIRPV